MGLLAGRYAESTRFDPQDLRAHRIGWMEYFVDGRPRPALARPGWGRQEILTSDGRTLAQGALA
jgi:hypothetical protein